jgi:hypothetical protein
MAGISVNFDSPAQNAAVGRKQLFFGFVTRFDGAVNTVRIQFNNGPSRIIPHSPGSFGWALDDFVPTDIRPGQAFQLKVEVFGTMIIGRDQEGGPITVDVSGEDTRTFVLENVVPLIAIDPIQASIATPDPPVSLVLAGSVSEGDPAIYGTPALFFRIGGGAFASLSVFEGRWSVPLTLQPGSYPIELQATDGFQSVTTVQTTLTVYRFPMPTSTDPTARRTLLGIPTTSSVTTWTRLEPLCRDADIGTSSSARLFDPMWLMTRQWQMGEFQSEDAGSPVQARVRATNAALTRCYFGELPAKDTIAAPYNPAQAPLETLVERRRMRPATPTDSAMFTLSIDAGMHFLRMLDANRAIRKYRPAFLALYAVRELGSSTNDADDSATRLAQLVSGRAVDARLLVEAFRRPAGEPIVLDPELGIAAGDVPTVLEVAGAWLSWYDALFTEPAGPSEEAWTPERLEYSLSVATRLSAQPQDALTLSAAEIDGGRLDWSSFDARNSANTAQPFDIDTTGDRAFTSLNEITVPSPVTFRGGPAPRFWELEDAKLAYGLLATGPTDLAHLLAIEYASSYGNDWFVVPFTIPVGSITRVDSLVVTDNFGVRTLVRPLGDPALPTPHFSMWQSSSSRRAGEPFAGPIANRFFLPPTISRSIDSEALEEVVFVRDEMANVAWGIEKAVESPVERALSRTRRATPTAPPTTSTDAPRYLLSSSVPEHWIPLLPIQQDVGRGKLISRLRRGAVLQPDGSNKLHLAQGQILNAGAELLLYDEEIPREGINVTKSRRMTRWMDGSLWVWTAFRAQVGHGEGSSQLQFDQVLDKS